MDSIEKYKIKKLVNEIETHDVFLDTLAHQKEREFGISEKKLEIKIKEKIIYSIFSLFFIISAIFFLKTFNLQIFEGDKFYAISQNNKGRINLVRPERGVIYDKNFKKLVLNSPAYDLICDRRNFSQYNPQSIKEIEIIANLLDKDSESLKNQIVQSEDIKVLIAENLSQEKILLIETRINDFPDCQIERNTIRNYVSGPVFSHIIGYMGRITKEELENNNKYNSNDYIGKDGLENYYEKKMRGIPGEIEQTRDAKGIKKEEEILSLPEEGHSLILNIDADFQKKVYDSLEHSIKNVGAQKGAAVALDPKTGAVLSLVSYPAYDDNVFSQRISKSDFEKMQNDPFQPFFNRAISSQYPTGSTIKPLLASAALEEKIISHDKLINDPGYISIQNKYDPSIVYTFGGVRPHGLVDMRKAIAVSSNIYFFTIGGGHKDQPGLGPSKIKKYLSLFGWGSKSGIDLPGEFKGFIPTPLWKKQTKNESWWDGDTYNLAIGQSDLQVTPLQVAVAYGVIANGGTLYKPQIVQKIISGLGEDQKVIKEFTPEIIRQNFIDPKNLQVVREGMLDGAKKAYGSSYMLNDLPIAVGAKTGTAETNKPGFYNTWSSNFAPYDDPKIVFVATIEGIQGFRSATLPVAKEVLQYYFSK